VKRLFFCAQGTSMIFDAMCFASHSRHLTFEVSGKLHRIELAPATAISIIMLPTLDSALWTGVNIIGILYFDVHPQLLHVEINLTNLPGRVYAQELTVMRFNVHDVVCF
jgi:hypothetical protein